MQSFRNWLEHRLEEVPGTMELATRIAQSGAAGVSQDGLRRVCELSPETLQDLLRALVAAGQVRVVPVGGRMVYRAAG
jgi:hypothetical protein